MRPHFYMVLYMISTPGYWIIGALPGVALPLTQQKKFHRYIKLKVSRVYYQSFIPFWTITLGTFPRTWPVPSSFRLPLKPPEKTCWPENCSQKHRIDPRIQNLAVGGLACKCHISVVFLCETKKQLYGCFNTPNWNTPRATFCQQAIKGCPSIVDEGDCLGCVETFLETRGRWVNQQPAGWSP